MPLDNGIGVNGISWKALWAEFDTTDQITVEHGKSFTNTNVCSKHQIIHHGVAGACPLCLLRTFLEEKERIATEMQEHPEWFNV